MEIKEFFEDTVENSEKYSTDMDFDIETKVAIHKYIDYICYVILKA